MYDGRASLARSSLGGVLVCIMLRVRGRPCDSDGGLDRVPECNRVVDVRHGKFVYSLSSFTYTTPNCSLLMPPALSRALYRKKQPTQVGAVSLLSSMRATPIQVSGFMGAVGIMEVIMIIPAINVQRGRGQRLLVSVSKLDALLTVTAGGPA